MKAPATAPSTRPRSAGVVVVRHDAARGWLALMLRVYRDWDFPKGQIDEGETPLEAAIREVAEEATITALSFDWGDAWCDTAPYSGGKIARYFLARTDSDAVTLGINKALGRAEHHEFRWMTFDTARTLARPRLQPIIDWAEERVRGQRDD